MQTLFDFSAVPVVAIDVSGRVGRPRRHEAVLVEGPQGWGEFSPLGDDDLATTARWLTAATEPGTVGWPDPVRGRIPVAVGVPAVDAVSAHHIVTESRCRTATVEVGSGDDVARLQAVRDALGVGGAIRCDAHGRWRRDEAAAAIARLDRAAGGLEFVARPCRDAGDVAALRRSIDIRIAMVASAEAGPAEAADIALLTCGPLGGARRALRVAERTGLPCVVTSGPQTTIGLGAGLALAGALPDLPFACDLAAMPDGDVVADSRRLRPVDGFLPVAPMPPAPQPDLLARHAVTDPDRVAWWRDRIRAAAAAV